jgi:hypothetical protein
MTAADMNLLAELMRYSSPRSDGKLLKWNDTKLQTLLFSSCRCEEFESAAVMRIRNVINVTS